MDSAAASLLVALPFACFGVFSFTGAALIRRFGASRLIAACLLLLAVGTAARAAMPTALLLILATIPIGVVIALIGVALPGMVKHHFAARGGTTTGFYASSINVGGALAALTIVPIAELVGGWRWAFALSAIPAGMALAVWFRADTDTDLEDTEAALGVLLTVSRGTSATSSAAQLLLSPAWCSCPDVEMVAVLVKRCPPARSALSSPLMWISPLCPGAKSCTCQTYGGLAPLSVTVTPVLT